jgi:hypothetical protein
MGFSLIHGGRLRSESRWPTDHHAHVNYLRPTFYLCFKSPVFMCGGQKSLDDIVRTEDGEPGNEVPFFSLRFFLSMRTFFCDCPHLLHNISAHANSEKFFSAHVQISKSLFLIVVTLCYVHKGRLKRWKISRVVENVTMLRRC